MLNSISAYVFVNGVLFAINRITWTLTNVAEVVMMATLVAVILAVARFNAQSNLFILWMILVLHGMAMLATAFAFAPLGAHWSNAAGTFFIVSHGVYEGRINLKWLGLQRLNVGWI